MIYNFYTSVSCAINFTVTEYIVCKVGLEKKKYIYL